MLKFEVKSRRTFGSRRSRYVARFGALEAEADTAPEARAELERLIERAASTENAVTVMFDLAEPGKVWVAHGDAHGWGYEIVRHAGCGASRASGVAGGREWTRDECLTHMREHWYANNIQPIVDGIIGLCTDWREWVCPRCVSACRGPAPYKCQSPACSLP